MMRFFIGIDLGQAQDYAAISVMECLKDGKETEYHLRHLARHRGESYPAIVDKVTKIMHTPALKGSASGKMYLITSGRFEASILL